MRPGLPVTTMTRKFNGSMALTTPSMASADVNGGGWP
jgi:hypothetical protein